MAKSSRKPKHLDQVDEVPVEPVDWDRAKMIQNLEDQLTELKSNNVRLEMELRKAQQELENQEYWEFKWKETSDRANLLSDILESKNSTIHDQSLRITKLQIAIFKVPKWVRNWFNCKV